MGAETTVSGFTRQVSQFLLSRGFRARLAVLSYFCYLLASRPSFNFSALSLFKPVAQVSLKEPSTRDGEHFPNFGQRKLVFVSVALSTTTNSLSTVDS